MGEFILKSEALTMIGDYADAHPGETLAVDFDSAFLIELASKAPTTRIHFAKYEDGENTLVLQAIREVAALRGTGDEEGDGKGDYGNRGAAQPPKP